jgi:hypothetical protein
MQQQTVMARPRDLRKSAAAEARRPGPVRLFAPVGMPFDCLRELGTNLINMIALYFLRDLSFTDLTLLAKLSLHQVFGWMWQHDRRITSSIDRSHFQHERSKTLQG